jgi:hypothetical protein
MQILTVKENGTDCVKIIYDDSSECVVPKSGGNLEYQKVLKWIDDGGVIEPEFTQSDY